MTAGIGKEATQIHFWEYINRIFGTVDEGKGTLIVLVLYSKKWHNEYAKTKRTGTEREKRRRAALRK